MTPGSAVVAAAAAAAAGGGAWALLVRRYRSGAVTARGVVWLLVAVGLALRLAFAIATPAFEGPDEADHVGYVAHVATERTFPSGPDDLRLAEPEPLPPGHPTARVGVAGGEEARPEERRPDPTAPWWQPPAYYVLAAPVYATADALGLEDLGTDRAIRLLSVALWGASMGFTAATLRNVRLGDPLVRVGVLGMLALLPTWVFVSSVASNDAALVAVATAVLWAATRPPTRRMALATGLLLGLALLTSEAAVVLPLALVGIQGVRWRQRGLSLRGAVFQLAVAGLVAAVIWAPWVWRNLDLHGEVLARSAAAAADAPDSVRTWLWQAQDQLKATFWAATGPRLEHRWLPVVSGTTTHLALAGLAWGLLRRGRPLLARHAHRLTAPLLAGAAALAVGAVGWSLRASWVFGGATGTVPYVALLPLAWLLVVGVELLGFRRLTTRPEVHAAGFLLTYAASFTAFALASFPELPLV